METTALTQEFRNFLNSCLAMAGNMVKLPAQHIWIDFDQEADVLYLSFRKPQRASKTIEIDEDILLRKDDKAIVGITVMNASSRQQP